MGKYMPFEGIVEGNRTGILVGSVAESDKHQKLQEEEKSGAEKKLRRVSLELQQALDNLKKKYKDEQKLRIKLAVTQLKFEEDVARRKLTVDHLFDLLLLHMKRTHAFTVKFVSILKQTEKERDDAFEKLHQERAAMANQMDMQKEMDALKHELEEARALMAVVKEESTRLRKENDESACSSSMLVNQLTTDLMRTQEQLQAAKRDLTAAQKKITDTDALVQQVQLFVHLICRPDFHVVKDASLQPVERNRPEPTGFVLVPLTVMLQGYTLLSVEDRRNLIESYQTYL